MSERAEEKTYSAWCKRNGLYCRKFVSPGRRGVPDRLVVIPQTNSVTGFPVTVFVEFKNPDTWTSGSEVAGLQRYELTMLEGMGVPVLVTADRDEAIAFTRTYMKQVFHA